jgi:hypothetical protein
MIRIGIDPGREGGIVAIDDDLVVLLAARLPHGPSPIGRGMVVDVGEVARLLRGLPRPRVVALEAPQSPRSAGGRQIAGSAGLAVGIGWGRLSAALDILGEPWHAVAASTWHAAIVGHGTGAPKARALATITRLLPGLEVVPAGCRVPHEGIVDAAGLALYARRLL